MSSDAAAKGDGTENILSRRNRLLIEENDSYRKQIEELNSYRVEYYNQVSRIEALKASEAELKAQNESLHSQLSEHQTLQDKVHQLDAELDATKRENHNLQQDLLREERLHCQKYQQLVHEFECHQMKYNDLLQRYSSMESFVEEFCENANQFGDDEEESEAQMQTLVKWSHLLQQKQASLDDVISSRVRHQLTDMQQELSANRQHMTVYQAQMSHNIAQCVLSEIVCKVVERSNEQRLCHEYEQIEGEKTRLNEEEAKLAADQRVMQSQLTQLHGQKHIISNLNGTIKDLCEKVKEYEHHIHRLTMQLKQLSLINKASLQCNTDFNVQQIQHLSEKLMEKELELDAVKHALSKSEAACNEREYAVKEMKEYLHDKSNEYQQLMDKYNSLKSQYQQSNAQCVEFEKERQSLKQEVVNQTQQIEQLSAMKKQYQVLQQNEFNVKLREQELEEKRKRHNEQFKQQLASASKQCQMYESHNAALQRQLDEYHSVVLKHKQHSKTVTAKYHQLKREYDAVHQQCNAAETQNATLQTQCDSALSKLKQYEHKVQHLVGQIKIYQHRAQIAQQREHSHHEQRNEEQSGEENKQQAEMIKNLQQEMESLHQQLCEGSNIRRQLREFLVKSQKEAQSKLNKSYSKLTALKQLLHSTLHVLHEQQEYVHKNDALRSHAQYLFDTLSSSSSSTANQENDQMAAN